MRDSKSFKGICVGIILSVMVAYISTAWADNPVHAHTWHLINPE